MRIVTVSWKCTFGPTLLLLSKQIYFLDISLTMFFFFNENVENGLLGVISISIYGKSQLFYL